MYFYHFGKRKGMFFIKDIKTNVTIHPILKYLQKLTAYKK